MIARARGGGAWERGYCTAVSTCKFKLIAYLGTRPSPREREGVATRDYMYRNDAIVFSSTRYTDQRLAAPAEPHFYGNTMRGLTSKCI